MNSKPGVKSISIALLLFAIAACFISPPLAAHESRPAIVSILIHADGNLAIDISLNLEASIAGINGEHSDARSDRQDEYERLRIASPGDLAREFDLAAERLVFDQFLVVDGNPIRLKHERVEIPEVGDVSLARISTLILTGEIGSGSREINWTATPWLGDQIIRVSRNDEPRPFFSTFLSASETSEPVSLTGILDGSGWYSFQSYLQVGFQHILPLGIDHVLFVISLFLLTPYIRPLLWQVTSFTLAHSITLALGILGIINLPANIVEPLIAASIAFVAVENLITDRLHSWRPVVIFVFGLLHGLGFAGVLSEVGLPPGEFAIALIGFNVGVELGQLTVLAVCFIAVGLQFRHRSWYRPKFSMPASLIIAIIAGYWLIERLSF